MSHQKISELLLKILAIVAMLIFTVWLSWAEGSLLALAPLAGAIWLASQIKRDGKSKTVSTVVVSLTVVVAIAAAAYFMWISSFTF